MSIPRHGSYESMELSQPLNIRSHREIAVESSTNNQLAHYSDLEQESSPSGQTARKSKLRPPRMSINSKFGIISERVD